MIQGGSREVQDDSLFKKELPLRVGESSIQAFHYKAVGPYIGPGEFRAIKTEVKQVAKVY